MGGPGGSHTTLVVQCPGPQWPSTEEWWTRATPHREDLRPCPACGWTPRRPASSSKGLAVSEIPGGGPPHALSSLFSPQPFLFHHLHQLMSVRGLAGLQARTPPYICADRTAGASRPSTPRQLSPLLAVPWVPRCFLRWLVGIFFFFFPFFGGFLLPVFPRRATSPQGSTSGARSHRGPLPTAVNSNGAAQASPWCSTPASVLSVPLSESGSDEPTA